MQEEKKVHLVIAPIAVTDCITLYSDQCRVGSQLTVNQHFTQPGWLLRVETRDLATLPKTPQDLYMVISSSHQLH